MAVPYAAIAAGVQAAKGVYDIFDAAAKNKQANKILRNTKRPVYNRQEEIDEIAQLADSEIQNTALADSFQRNAAQGLSQGIDAVLKSGGQADFSSINSSYGQSLERALMQLNRERASRVAASNTANYNVAKAKDLEFSYNVDQPYRDAMQLAASLKQQAAKAKADGFTNIAGAVSNFGTSQLKPGMQGKSGQPSASQSVDEVLGGAGKSPVTNIQRGIDDFIPPTDIAAPEDISPMSYWDTVYQSEIM